jgi:homocysteine S-methyltransferase
MPFANADARKVTTILDGSTGYVLLQNGLPEDEMFSKIWSASAFVDEKYHDIVVKTHRKYMEVGATSITTNSYATQPTYYENAFGQGYEQIMLEHAELSAKLAVKAREQFLATNPDAKICIQGSLPPLVESHRPDLFKKALDTKGEEFFIRHYNNLAQALVRGGADVLLFETLNCWEEARLGLEAMVQLGRPDVPILVSFEGSIRDENFTPQPWLAPELCEKVLHYKSEKKLPIKTIGWNCAPPEDILQNFEVLKETGMLDKLSGQGVGTAVYANMHERKVYDEGFDVGEIDATKVVDPNISPVNRRKSIIKRRSDLTQYSESNPFKGYVKFCSEYVRQYGCSAVGGCCGCGPEGIEALHGEFKG